MSQPDSDRTPTRAGLTTAQVEHFRAHGYLVLDRIIEPALLAAMQQECDRNLDLQRADMERVGSDTLGLSQRNRRYFLPDRFDESAALTDFLFGPVVRTITALLGPDAYLFLDLFVVKSAHAGTPFAWHQDSGYLMGQAHRPYITLWCALDDMTSENGTLHVLPYDRAPSRNVTVHVKDRGSNDLVGYNGTDRGDVLAVASGSIIVLASNVFHCSGANLTESPRRAYVVSLSPEPVVDQDGHLWNLAVPIVKDGHAVAPPQPRPVPTRPHQH